MKRQPSLFVPDVQRKQMSDHMDAINLLIVCHAAFVSRGYDRNLSVFSVRTYTDVIFFVSKVNESLCPMTFCSIHPFLLESGLVKVRNSESSLSTSGLIFGLQGKYFILLLLWGGKEKKKPDK